MTENNIKQVFKPGELVTDGEGIIGIYEGSGETAIELKVAVYIDGCGKLKYIFFNTFEPLDRKWVRVDEMTKILLKANLNTVLSAFLE